MNIPELFTSLVNEGFQLSVEGAEIVVSGSGKLSSEQLESIKDNKPEIVKLLEPEDQAEREAIQWMNDNPTEALAKANEIGDWFTEQAKHHEHRTFIWNQVGSICNEHKLNEFKTRFLADIDRHDDYREIAGEVLELIESRRLIIRDWWNFTDSPNENP